ncbi:E3 ubiquitin-protein ligase listerin [Thalictrum thalictroides]|uniref:E3 ubiquitin-protein ligase listerin n=1 Tax=Thalictrum thalictroides TaxID=46969 RepID=A0A7J6WYH5_THATH|nr:E3 ubiquitin-protein ligase listerin [Thalictrum thalictroides]
MGRPKGDPARSKNRPSSSSLAASLLPTGAAIVGFGGYVGSSRLDPTEESVSATPFVDVDGEVAQHLKRLGRKDPITKIKALASLSELFKQKNKEDIVQIIPQWAFEYKRLVQDYNREVRRATHDTMTNLVITVGRGLAPYLKSLMGPWWLSQLDPVSEVSQAARRSLQEAFPVQEKRLDALILCTNEIFMYIEENLKLTPETMSDKASPLDELEEMHFRVILTSLLAFATLFDILFGRQLQRLGFDKVSYEPKNASKAKEIASSSAERIFSTHKYLLDFLKSKSPAVRSATYSALGSLIKHIPHLINEENMKTLSASILGAFQEKDPSCHPSMWDTILLFCKRFPDSWGFNNIQKTVLNRYWHFLRNGCYGSQQVSYPILILFLDNIPPKAIEGEQFFLSFFQNLWQGRNPSSSSTLDRLAFFKAFKECFLWVIHNASRYSKGIDDVHHFQVSLVDGILVNLLWHDYLLIVDLKNQGGVSVGMSCSSLEEITPHSQGRRIAKLNAKYSLDYMQDLGICIIEILSVIALKECGLFATFSRAFQENCLEIIQQAEQLERPSEHVVQIENFLILLDKHAVQKGETWPLEFLAVPMMTKAFPSIRSLDSLDAVKLLSVTISIFGPRKIVSPLSVWNKSNASNHESDAGDNGSLSDSFLCVFKEVFIPWCLRGSNPSTTAHLDLLLALLDDELFAEQWSSIIRYATRLNEHHGHKIEYSDFDHISVLAMLMEKVREFVRCKMRVGSIQHSIPLELWHHELLDSTAVSLARLSPPYQISYTRFLRAVLGGSTEDDQISFVSRDSMILILRELLNKFVQLLNGSSFTWARDASSLILDSGLKDLVVKYESNVNILELAKFSLEVLEGSVYCLKEFEEEPELVPCISAAIFIIDWEYRMSSHIDVTKSSKMYENVHVELLEQNPFYKSIHAFLYGKTAQFWKSLSMQTVRRLEAILIPTIRSAIFEAGTFCLEAPSLCCHLMLEVLEFFDFDFYKEQILLDKLLDESEVWPLWVGPSLNDDSRSATLKFETLTTDAQISRHNNFVAFISELISKCGVGRVIAGSISQTSLSSSVEAPPQPVPSHSRAWVAAEVLCTWKWRTGSVLDSFLPLLSEFARREDSSSENLLDSIVNILLDGALLHETSDEICFLKVWFASDDEVESIQNPFLRALVSLLFTLVVKDNIWGKRKSAVLFNQLVDKLFDGMMVNRNCLRILPYITNVLVQPLRHKDRVSDKSFKDAPLDSFNENQMSAIMKDWLQRGLLLPPITSWLPGKDFEEWTQVIISCYPLDPKGGSEALKVASQREISDIEIKLLVDLFRKQQTDGNILLTVNKSPLVLTTLSKLTSISIGYCWKEFNEDDWGFVLSLVQECIDSAVVVIEEIAENVDEIIMESTENLEIVIHKLDEVVHTSDQSLMDIASSGLFTFSLISGLLEGPDKEKSETDRLSSLKTEKWLNLKDQIFEIVLRLFFATGATEAIASSCCQEASSIVASSRLLHPHFWELVASTVVSSPPHVRNSAVQSMGLWQLSKGPIGSLYAILFSSIPNSALQFAAYVTLSTDPISKLSITNEDTAGCLAEENTVEQEIDQSRLESSSDETVQLREEISFVIKNSPSKHLEMDLVAQDQVNVFISWALLLSHLQSLPSTSPAKQRLVQCIQDSANSKILDCLFEHIPLKAGITHGLKRKDVELPAEVSQAASAATRAITTGSLLFSVESLYLVGREAMASLAGAIYGLMLHALPSYVRDWFTSLRDRTTSAAIESFTKTWCSPPLLADELSQIKKASLADENFSVSVSKSAFEVVATYKKEETGMDLVISLPLSYPLRPVDVVCTRSLGIVEQKQRKWFLSMIAFVRSQNGALAEAIRRWKINFDKEFEGVEECPICYSIIHTSNNSLPRLACRTCKHKFHSACLYKWFSTSHKSTCPLCQSPF